MNEETTAVDTEAAEDQNVTMGQRDITTHGTLDNSKAMESADGDCIWMVRDGKLEIIKKHEEYFLCMLFDHVNKAYGITIERNPCEGATHRLPCLQQTIVTYPDAKQDDGSTKEVGYILQHFTPPDTMTGIPNLENTESRSKMKITMADGKVVKSKNHMLVQLDTGKTLHDKKKAFTKKDKTMHVNRHGVTHWLDDKLVRLSEDFFRLYSEIPDSTITELT